MDMELVQYKRMSYFSHMHVWDKHAISRLKWNLALLSKIYITCSDNA